LTTWGANLILLWVFVGLPLMAFYDFQHGQPSEASLKIMTLPLLLVFGVSYFVYMPIARRKTRILISIPLWIFASVATAFFSSGHLLAINSAIGKSNILFKNGVVVDRRLTGNKGVHILTILPDGIEHTLDLQVWREEYHRFKKGDSYNETWYVGSLGLIYK